MTVSLYCFTASLLLLYFIFIAALLPLITALLRFITAVLPPHYRITASVSISLSFSKLTFVIHPFFFPRGTKFVLIWGGKLNAAVAAVAVASV
jgi:hypothetical protein